MGPGGAALPRTAQGSGGVAEAPGGASQKRRGRGAGEVGRWGGGEVGRWGGGLEGWGWGGVEGLRGIGGWGGVRGVHVLFSGTEQQGGSCHLNPAVE